ncbi:MAG: EamA family transporter [Candidatus Metalachnospira sp.]|nr:EamA family transporter [Candidatus Metalachnospira sp.]
MLQMYWPILVVVAANTVYNICAKSTPEAVQPFASLTVTYLVAAILSAIMFFITSKNKNLVAEFSSLNWTSFVFGCAIVALEFGYIYIYRVGWKMGIGSLVANVALACVLLIVGMLLYKQHISIKQIAGFMLCLGGIVLISK